MLESLNFNVGQRGNKWHAVWLDGPDGQLEGPARDTREEAEKDRDQVIAMAKEHIQKNFPNAVITVRKIQ